MSPLLFKVYIDDLLKSNFACVVPSYADDIKIIGHTGLGIQHDLDVISKWSEDNHSPINNEKCELLRFGAKSDIKYFINGPQSLVSTI